MIPKLPRSFIIVFLSLIDWEIIKQKHCIYLDRLICCIFFRISTDREEYVGEFTICMLVCSSAEFLLAKRTINSANHDNI